MWATEVYATIYVLCWMASAILISLMIQYVKNKPLGMQTSLDQASIDIGIVTLVTMTVAVLNVIVIIAFTDGIGYALALTLYLITMVCLEFLIANWIINIWHRYFMIFHTAVMWTATDREIMKVSRCLKVLLCILAFQMDMFKNEKKSLGLMYLTKSTYET